MQEEEGTRMSLAEHLGELRTRLAKCAIAVLVLGVAALVFAKPIFGVLMQPVLQALPPDQRALIYTSGIEELNVLMKVGVYCGVFLSTPVVLWQLWGFVSPGLYPKERRMAGPFVALGTLAFVAGLVFCYLAVLPGMFRFLLNEGDSAALEERLQVGRMLEEDALRFARLGSLERAAALAARTAEGLRSDGEGSTAGSPAGSLAPDEAVEVRARLEGFGRLLDATAAGLPAAARPRLLLVMEKRLAAVDAFGKGEVPQAAALLDEAAGLLGGAAGQGEELAGLWHMEKELSVGSARYDAQRWTRPMLTMREQLSLVLLLMLAFGIIFELPLVMAVLGSVGLVSSRFLFKYQRHAFVVCLIAAAIITPTGDVVNLSLMAGPMLACYELGVLAVWLIERRKAKAAALSPAS
jgi:sec-independent protein translocase protein TatC